MKPHRLTALLLLTLLLLFVSACTAKKEAHISFYYRTAEQNSGENELLAAEDSGMTQSDGLEELAAQYFAGPLDAALRSPFPKGASLLHYTRTGNRLSLSLGGMAQLSGVDRSLALSCLYATFSQLDGVEELEISMEKGKQTESVLLDAQSILTADNTQGLVENTLKVYYSDDAQRYLVAQECKTKLTAPEEQAVYAVSLLASSPSEGGLLATLPKDTELLDLSIENGVCSVDFSDEFYENRPQTELGERMTLLSIVNTLTEFSEIESVQFFVEGEVLDTYYKMDLSLSYVREESAIGPVRVGLNEKDCSLYVLRSADNTLAEIPTRLRPTSSETDADAIMSLLLSFTAQNGYQSALPEGTGVLSLEKSAGYCYLDLSREFADGLHSEEEERLAVQAIVRSLYSLNDVSFVVLTIEGERSGLQYVRLDQIF